MTPENELEAAVRRVAHELDLWSADILTNAERQAEYRRRYLVEYPEFERQYVYACEARTRAWAEEIIEIADGTKDADPVAIQRDRLRIDTRKWLVAKCMPKKYGNNPDHEHGGSVTIIVRNNFDDEDDAELPSGAPRLIDAKPLQ